MKRTPYFEAMVSLGGKMVEFAGFEMPIQFSEGIIFEHNAVRNNVGLFDVSHMGEFTLKGKGAEATIQRLVTNDINGMEVGHAKYSLMLNDKGGEVDDILIYKFGSEDFMFVVNAGNIEKDAKWVESHLLPFTKFENISDSIVQLAIQGRNAEPIVKEFLDNIPEKNYTFTVTKFLGEKIIVSRTGYTAEDGFELYINVSKSKELLDKVLEIGKKYDLCLCGLGARDTLRLEGCMPLYGHEMNEERLASELSLNVFIKMDKPDFIGKQALLDNPPKKKRKAAILERGIAREGSEVWSKEGKKIGIVTSGTMSPTLKHGIVMMSIDKDFDEKEVDIEVRGKKLSATVTPMPLYKRAK